MARALAPLPALHAFEQLGFEKPRQRGAASQLKPAESAEGAQSGERSRESVGKANMKPPRRRLC